MMKSKLSPKAEALKEALCRVLIQAKHDIGSYEESLCDRVAVQSARAIVEELGITEKDLKHLTKIVTDHPYGSLDLIYALSTLLELAKDST